MTGDGWYCDTMYFSDESDWYLTINFANLIEVNSIVIGGICHIRSVNDAIYNQIITTSASSSGQSEFTIPVTISYAIKSGQWYSIDEEITADIDTPSSDDFEFKTVISLDSSKDAKYVILTLNDAYTAVSNWSVSITEFWASCAFFSTDLHIFSDTKFVDNDVASTLSSLATDLWGYSDSDITSMNFDQLSFLSSNDPFGDAIFMYLFANRLHLPIVCWSMMY